MALHRIEHLWNAALLVAPHSPDLAAFYIRTMREVAKQGDVSISRIRNTFCDRCSQLAFPGYNVVHRVRPRRQKSRNVRLTREATAALPKARVGHRSGPFLVRRCRVCSNAQVLSALFRAAQPPPPAPAPPKPVVDDQTRSRKKRRKKQTLLAMVQSQRQLDLEAKASAKSMWI